MRPSFDDCHGWHNLTVVSVGAGRRRGGHPVSERDEGTGLHLPHVLDCLPGPAVVIGNDYRITAASSSYRRAFAAGEEVVGRHCYEVSHRYTAPCDQAGESCPIARCRESGQPSRVLHVHFTSSGPQHEEVTTHPLPDSGGGPAFLEVIRPAEIASARPSKEGLVGHSPPFNRMLELATRVAPTDTPVLLLGESGTGKEGLAQAIHAMSPRASGRFVPLDCSGVTESLFESELFGYERGAFTGASQRKTGLVETCDRGTLFLDEIGDVPLALQVKLLRLIETRTFRRVGSTEPRRSDFRLICATHHDLRRMVEDGTFRRDLFHRIGAFPIPLPPLRDRREDLPLLVESLMRRLGRGDLSRVHPYTLAALEAYPFPGNVRELQNVIERSCLLAGSETILPEHLPEEVLAAARDGAAEQRPNDIVPLEEAERRYLRWALATFPGERRELARRLGLSERTFYRKVQNLT
jgi:two-component system response regulator HydG